MIKIFIILLFFVPCLLFGQNSNFEWAKSFDSDNSVFTSSIVTDSSSNVYVCGRFEGIMDADPSSSNHHLNSNGDYDLFLVKLSENGDLIWAISIGGTGNDDATDIAIDSNQNICVTGGFTDQVDFDPDPLSQVSLTADVNSSGFVSKFDSSGGLIWVKRLDVIPKAFSIDNLNNFYLTGSFWDQVDFDPGQGTFFESPMGTSSDCYVLKLDDNGDFIWVRVVGGQGFETGVSIATDEENNVIYTGIFNGSVDLNFGSGTNTINSGSNFWAFVEKIDKDGIYQWANVLSGSYNTRYQSVDVDAEGNYYISAEFYDTVDIDPGSTYNQVVSNGASDILIQKFLSDGTMFWTKHIGGSLYETGWSIHVNGESLFLSGQFQDTVDFDPSINQDYKISNGGNDVFAMKLDTAGVFKWVKSFGGDYDDRSTDIVSDNVGNAYFVGHFNDTVDLNPDVNVQIEIAPQYMKNMFVEKINRCTIKPNQFVLNSCEPYEWINGETYYGDEIISLNLNSAAVDGCDSLIQLFLTVQTVDTSVTLEEPILTANSTSASYQWLSCDNNYSLINGETNQSFVPSSNGVYAVQITENGCTDTSACIEVNNLQLKNSSFNPPLIHPNPTRGQLVISMGDLILPDLKIYSSTGQLVYSENRILDPTYEIFLNQPEGVYIIQLSDKSNLIKYKLVKI